MKKILLGVIILLIIIALGWFFMRGKKETGKDVQTTGNQEKVEEKSVIDSTKEALTAWLAKKIGTECTINDKKDGTMTVKAKDGKAKIEGFASMGLGASITPEKKEKGTMISDGEWVYVWSGKQDGIKFNVKEMEELNKTTGNTVEKNQSLSEQMSWEKWAQTMESSGADYSCKPASLSDSDFLPPADVKFVDWGVEMKKIQEMSNNISKDFPAPTGN